MKSLINWFRKLLLEEYHITIWYDADPSAKTVYKLKKIEKINNQYLKGISSDGYMITLSVETPFNYEVKKVL
jgi:hypothetical protein